MFFRSLSVILIQTLSAALSGTLAALAEGLDRKAGAAVQSAEAYRRAAVQIRSLSFAQLATGEAPEPPKPEEPDPFADLGRGDDDRITERADHAVTYTPNPEPPKPAPVTATPAAVEPSEPVSELEAEAREAELRERIEIETRERIAAEQKEGPST